MADRMYVNQQVNIGPETTPGTNVAAGKRINCFTWTDGVEADVKTYRGSGRKYVSEQDEEKEWMSWDIAGPMDFNGVLYLASGVYAKLTPALHAPSATAYDWKYIPPITGAATLQTYTVEHGDTVRAHKANFVMPTDFGYKVSRGGGSFDLTAKAISQSLQDSISLTATPTNVVISPVTPKMVNIYLDTTSAGLGGTQIVLPFSFEYNRAGVFNSFWALNRTNSSFTGYSDLAPKVTAKLKVEANAEGMAYLPYLQSGTTYYLRIDAVGPAIDVPNSINAEIKHDMAVKFGKPSKFEDEQGLFAIEWELEIVEDTAWGSGQAEEFWVTNLISAL